MLILFLLNLVFLIEIKTDLNCFSMKKSKKNEIAQTVEEAIGWVLERINITKPSKKTEKMVKKGSKEFSNQLEKQLKKEEKKIALAAKKAEKSEVALKKKAKAKK